MGNTVGSLTQFQRSMIIGSILGDGYLRIFPGRKNALLEINHSLKQKEYVEWKYTILKNVTASPPKARKGNGNRFAYRFYTKQLPELSNLYFRFYKNGKKAIPKDLTIDGVMLAVWFMDDGTRCGTSYYLNTQQYSTDDHYRLVRILKNFGLDVNINKDKTYQRLRFRSASVPRLKFLIGPYIISSMKYKLG